MEENYRPIRVLSLDGADIYRAMHRVRGPQGLCIKNKNGKLDTDRFRGLLDASLDTDCIKRVYARHKELPGSFRVCKEYTTAVASVSFDLSVKAFYNKTEHLFVRDGYDVSFAELSDHALIIEEEGTRKLIALEIAPEEKADKTKKAPHYAPVENPIPPELMPDFFGYDEERRGYFVKRKGGARAGREAETLIPTVKAKKEVRAWLYENGFEVDGVHYVRYKRSAGSSREGHCLFIAEPLYADMMAWSACGIRPSEVRDQASYQAYISLTLSSIEKKIHIPRKAILLLPEGYSRFTDSVVAVREAGGTLVAKREEVEIENAIWDGEALLDASVFEENGYADKGMMLLRNRFFKTCAFNTNLTAWFEDHGITKLSQLGGYPSKKARSLSDIKLVITESSLKYLKFKGEGESTPACFERWLDNVFVGKEDEVFGVVKTDKATGPMAGRMVKTNYQLLNTLSLSAQEVDEFLAPSLDFLHEMQSDSMYLRYHANLFVEGAYEGEDGSTVENYRMRLISDIMRRNDRFAGTAFYRDYRSELCRSFKKRMKNGRVLVDGGYHTLFGNGLEFLEALIDKNYQVDRPSALGDGEIYTPRFADGEELLCERSPHITMGNLYLAKNKAVPAFERYFNLGSARAIVCVNAIRSNLQQRLNGCDYDSDTMLITNNPVLRRAAARCYADFPVPFCAVQAGGRVAYTTAPADLAALDVKISENKIGEIVNLSQFLNSLLWDVRAAGGEIGERLYLDICKLAVLSGMEIDKAKRLYPVSADAVLAELRGYKAAYLLAHGQKIPAFFAFITEGKLCDKASPDVKMRTAMSFVYDAVNNDKIRAPRSEVVPYSDLFELDYTRADPTGAYVKRRDAILDFVCEAQKKIRHLNFISKNKRRSERIFAMEQADALFTACKEKIAKVADDHLYYLLLRELDEREAGEGALGGGHTLLFAAACYANDAALLKKLKKSNHLMLDIILLPEGAKPDPVLYFEIYGHGHTWGRRHKHPRKG